MKSYTEGIDPHTGEYVYRERRRTKPQPPQFVLDFENTRTQLEGKCSPEWVDRIVMMIRHLEALHLLGVIPERYERRIGKQITLKAISAMAKFRKSNLNKS